MAFVAVTTVYFHNFWGMTGVDRINNMIHALKNQLLIGGLLIIAGYPRNAALVEKDSYRRVNLRGRCRARARDYKFTNYG